MELNNFNFIQAQSVFNQSIVKSIKKTHNFNTFGLIVSAVTVAALIAEMKLQKEETDIKIKRLEEEIRELERGD